MVLTDIVFPESEDDFVLEISLTSTGTLSDIVCKGDTTSGHVVELTQGFYPAESDVETGVTYGPTNTEYTGNVTLPIVGDVRTAVKYGANGTEFTGTYGGGGGGGVTPIIGGHHIIQREAEK